MDYYDLTSFDATYEDLINRVAMYNRIRVYLLTILAIVGMVLTFSITGMANQASYLVLLFGCGVALQLLFGGLLVLARRNLVRKDYFVGIIILALLSDVVIFSATIFLTGGADSKFAVLYLLPIIISANLFTRKLSYLTAGLSSIFYLATIVMFEQYFNDVFPNTSELSQAIFYCTLLFIFTYLSNYLFAYRQQNEADNAQLEMISLASHQLRTPATAVKGFLSLVNSGQLGTLKPKQKDFLSRAYDENDLELRLIDNILNVARIELKNLQPHMQNVDLTQLIDDVLSEHMQKILARDQHIEFKSTNPSEHVTTRADYQLLRIVVDNLVSNAIKYTRPKGDIIILLKQKPDVIEFSVEDNGMGISKADQKRLFKRFSRAADIDRDSIEGSGLGLYIIKEIIKLHDGKISVTSYKDVGSIFTVTLPRRKANGKIITG